jgi:hypothetical protein
VRAARRGAIERDAQEAFVQAFEVEWPSAR